MSSIYPLITANTTINLSAGAKLYPFVVTGSSLTITLPKPSSDLHTSLTLINVSTEVSKTLVIQAVNASGTSTTNLTLTTGAEMIDCSYILGAWTVFRNNSLDPVVTAVSAITADTTIPNTLSSGALIPVALADSAITLTQPSASTVHDGTSNWWCRIIFTTDAGSNGALKFGVNCAGAIVGKTSSLVTYAGSSKPSLAGIKRGDELLLMTNGTAWFVSGTISGTPGTV